MRMLSQSILENYYKKINRREQLEYEIEKLERSNNHLKNYVNVYDPVMNMEDRIKLNNKLIADKYIEIDNIIKDISNIEHIISNLTDEERAISKLRFDKKKEYILISREMNMSQSTVCRRVKDILLKIDKAEQKIS